MDYNLTTQVSNPYAADAYGNFSFYVPTLPFPNVYLIQLSPASGVTWSYLFDGPGGTGAAGCTTVGPAGTLQASNGSGGCESAFVQVNGVDLATPNPVNFIDSPTVTVTNPGTGQIQFVAAQQIGLDTNGTPNISQALLNFTDTATILFTNPSGGVESATCVTSTISLLGCVKPDGTTISITGGTITAVTATSSTLGIVKPDNTTITISGGVISAAPQSSLIIQAEDVTLNGKFAAGIGQTIDFNSTLPAAPAKSINCAWQTDPATGRVSCNVPALNPIETFIVPPIGGNYVLLYPTTNVFAGGALSLDNGDWGCEIIGASGIVTSGSCSRTLSGPWEDANGKTLAQLGISTGSVTSVYGVTYSNFNPGYFLDGSGVSTIVHLECTGLSPTALSNSDIQSKQVTALTGLSGAGIATASCPIQIQRNSSGGTASNSNLNLSSLALMVFYSGPAVASPNSLKIGAGLFLDPPTNTLSVDPSFPIEQFGITIAKLPSPTGVPPSEYIVTDPVDPFDCTIGGGGSSIPPHACNNKAGAWTTPASFTGLLQSPAGICPTGTNGKFSNVGCNFGGALTAAPTEIKSGNLPNTSPCTATDTFTAGKALVVVLQNNTAPPTDGGDTFTLVWNASITGTTTATYIATNIAGGSTTISATGLCRGTYTELDNVATSSPIDGTPVTHTQGTTPVAYTVGPLTTTLPNDLIFTSELTCSGTPTIGLGFKQLGNGSIGPEGFVDSAIGSGIGEGIYQATWTSAPVCVGSGGSAYGIFAIKSALGSSSGITLTTTGSSGASTFSGGVLNIPQYQGAITLTTTGTSGVATFSGGTLNIPNYAPGTGSVTSVAQTVPAWLAIAGSPITTSGTLAITAATGQTSHQVIGTCNAATSFGPCALVAGDLPSTAVTPGSYTNTNITVDAQGRITLAANGSAGSSGLSGMTAGQVPIAATASTVTSSKALAGSGAGITTGPTTSTNLDCAQFSGTAGQIADAGAPCGSGSGGGYTNVTGTASETTVALLNAIPACSGGGTLYATTPLSIATGGTVTCPVQFSKAGLWTIASGQTVTFAKNVTETDAPAQHFTGSGVVVLAATQAEPRTAWWGDVGDWNGSTGTDDTAAIQACITAISSGTCVISTGGHKISTGPLSITKSAVGLVGTVQGGQETTTSVTTLPSYFVNTSASANTLNIAGASQAAHLQENVVKYLAFNRSITPTGTSTGLSIVHAWATDVEHVSFNDNIRQVWASDADFLGTGGLQYVKMLWGFNGVSDPAGTYCGLCIDSANPPRSLTLSYANIAQNSQAGTFYGIYSNSGAVSDIMLDQVQTFQMHHSLYLNGLSGNTRDINLTNAIFDTCLGDCVYVNGVPSGGGNLNIRGGWFASASGNYNIDIESSVDVSIKDAQIYTYAGSTIASVYVNASLANVDTNQISPAAGGVGILINASTVGSANSNSIVSQFGACGTGIKLTGSSYYSLIGNTIATCTNGITLDATSNHNQYANLNNVYSNVTNAIVDAGTGNQFSAGTTTNALTMNNSGSGAASGSTFDGSAAKTISYNTIGAAPLASPTFTGTVTIPSGASISGFAPLASPTFTGTPAGPTAGGGTNTTQFATTAFVQAAIAAAGTGAGIVTYSGPSLTLSGTQYFPIGGGGLASTTEANVDIDSPAAVTIQNMTVQMSAAPGVGDSVVYTWRKNGSDTVLTCTISGASATSCSDTTHNFSTASLDLLSIKAVTTGTIVGTPTVVMAAQVGIAATATTAFSALSGGTNTAAAMVVGSGASMDVSGTGTINATKIGGITVTGTPSTGYVPTATSSSAATWQAAAGGYPALTSVSVSAANVLDLSACFSSSYDTYSIYSDGPLILNSGSNNVTTAFRFKIGGSFDTASNYYYARSGSGGALSNDSKMIITGSSGDTVSTSGDVNFFQMTVSSVNSSAVKGGSWFWQGQVQGGRYSAANGYIYINTGVITGMEIYTTATFTGTVKCQPLPQ